MLGRRDLVKALLTVPAAKALPWADRTVLAGGELLPVTRPTFNEMLAHVISARFKNHGESMRAALRSRALNVMHERFVNRELRL